MSHDYQILGYVEWVEFSDLGLPPFEAKIDSGAKRTCLNAFDIEPFKKNGETYVRFKTCDVLNEAVHECEAKVIKQIKVFSSNGIGSKRYVIETAARVGGIKHCRAEITLKDRREMAYSVLYGRHSMPGCLVDPTETYLTGGKKHPYRGTKRQAQEAE